MTDTLIRPPPSCEELTSPAAVPPRLAGSRPPAQRPTGFALLRTIVRNPIDAWSPAFFEDDVCRSRFMGRDTLFVLHPDLVREVLVDKADAFVRAEAIRRALGPVLGDGILTADGASWRRQRRVAAPVFRHERLQRFTPAMLAAAEHTRAQWCALPPGQEIDVAGAMMRTTFDIILATMISGEATLDVDRIERSITDYLDATTWILAFTMLRLPDWLPHPGQWRAARARRYLRAEIIRLAAGRRDAMARGAVPRDDLLSLLLEARDPETGAAMGDESLTDNLLTFISAGHETTALTLTWTFYLLSLHPDVEARVLAETEAVTGGGPLLPAHADALPFTAQVIQEALRLYPPAPIAMRTAARDVTIGAETVPAGTPVYVPTYAVQRHRALWVEPERFDPDRFAPDLVKARHRYAFFPFGAGPRTCIGMGFAMLEAVLILATLLRAVRLRLRPGWEPELKMRVTLRPAAGMPMTVEPRG